MNCLEIEKTNINTFTNLIEELKIDFKISEHKTKNLLYIEEIINQKNSGLNPLLMKEEREILLKNETILDKILDKYTALFLQQDSGRLRINGNIQFNGKSKRVQIFSARSSKYKEPASIIFRMTLLINSFNQIKSIREVISREKNNNSLIELNNSNTLDLL